MWRNLFVLHLGLNNLLSLFFVMLSEFLVTSVIVVASSYMPFIILKFSTISPLALLKSKLGKSSLLSLSEYVSLFSPLTLLVVSLYSLYHVNIFSIYIGLHTGLAYSKIGLTKPTNKGTRISYVLPFRWGRHCSAT